MPYHHFLRVRCASIWSTLWNSSLFIPRHFTPAWFQLFWLDRFIFQNGQVRHCSGRTKYILQPRPPFPSSRKVQSPLGRSFRLSRSPTRRIWPTRKSISLIFRNFAISPSSYRLTHTYPGSPVQHCPHCSHLKCNPSAYHFLPKISAPSIPPLAPP